MLGRYSEPLVTPQEIVKLGRHSGVESIYRAKEILEATQEASEGGQDNYYTFLCALANIYDAGHLQGIREERLKKKISI